MHEEQTWSPVTTRHHHGTEVSPSPKIVGTHHPKDLLFMWPWEQCFIYVILAGVLQHTSEFHYRCIEYLIKFW